MKRSRTFFIRALLLLIVLMTPFTMAVAAEITAHVSRNEVTLDETFQLSIVSDSIPTQEPDFSAVSDEFRIVNQSQSQNIQMTNGRVTRTIRWNLMLQAKQRGELVIPAIAIGNDQTKPIKVKVNAPAPAKEALAGEDIFLKVEVDRERAYPGQQILLTVRLYRGISTETASLTQPQTNDPDILIRKLGEDEQFHTQVNERRYSVVERRYALFPSRAGRLELAPFRFEGKIMASRRRGNRLFSLPFDDLRQPGHLEKVQSRALELEILPPPSEAKGVPWLPGSNLQLVESWGKQKPAFKVGEPVTRTLMLVVDGVTSAQLPAFETVLPDGLKQYPDQPLLEDREDRNGIAGIRQIKIAIVPNRAGSYTLPPIHVDWWNVDKARMERASIAQQTIEVQAATTNESDAGSLSSSVDTDKRAAETPPETAPTVSGSQRFHPDTLTLLLAFGWILTLLGWWYNARQRHSRVEPVAPVAPPDGRVSLSAVRTACHDNEPAAAQHALLAWGRAQWPDDPPRSLGRIAARVNAPALAEQLDRLERSLYSDTGDDWHGQPLLKQLERYSPGQQENHRSTPRILAPLQPD